MEKFKIVGVGNSEINQKFWSEFIGEQNSDAILRFDSGNKLSLKNAVRSTIAIGSTGSGKTKSVILPIIKNVVERGLSGVVIDVKGNLKNEVVKIAKHFGRDKDIVEFGTSDSAQPTNFLEGMSDHEIQNFLNSIVIHGNENDHNLHFHLHGARIYFEIYKTLQILSNLGKRCEFTKMFTPTLDLIFKIASERSLASGIWNYFKSVVAKKQKYSIEINELLTEIDMDAFHVLKDFIAMETVKRNLTYQEQLNYALNVISTIFKQFKYCHNLLDKFSDTSPSVMPIDFGKLVYKDRKIVLLHFAMDSGLAGEIFAGLLKVRFYRSVFKNGLASDTPTFMIADEFQHCVDFDNPEINDIQFFSLSREFKNINCVATQSIDSLLAKSRGNRPAIESFLANCVSRIHLQSTKDHIFWLNELVNTKQLAMGECVVETVDSMGRSVAFKDSLNAEYTEIQQLHDDPSEIKKTVLQKNEIFPSNVRKYLVMDGRGDINIKEKETFKKITDYQYEMLENLRKRSEKNRPFRFLPVNDKKYAETVNPDLETNKFKSEYRNKLRSEFLEKKRKKQRIEALKKEARKKEAQKNRAHIFAKPKCKVAPQNLCEPAKTDSEESYTKEPA